MWRCTRWSGTASRATTAGRTSTAGFSSCSRRRSGVAAEHPSGARPWVPVVPRRRGSRPPAARREPGASPLRAPCPRGGAGGCRVPARRAPCRAWSGAVGAPGALGRYGLTTELYGFTAGAGAAAEWGALGAVTFRPAEWIVVDAGGSVGLWRETPHLVFVGVTTNLGAVFK